MEVSRVGLKLSAIRSGGKLWYNSLRYSLNHIEIYGDNYII